MLKSFILTSLTACATFSTVLAAVIQQRDTCSSPVTLTGNAFATRQLFATPYYAAKVAAAVTRIADPALAARAEMIGRVGTFMWIDQIAVIPTIDAMIKAVPCTHIIGFVIYDLPGRDCGGEASGGEYQTGELPRYKSEYIDAIRRVIVANPNVAIALIIEPDSLPNAITALNHPRCFASVQEYKDGIAYALAQFNLPNVVMYIDAGNGNWLGWDPNVAPAAKVIADVWKAAGSPSQVRGIATNVANWNAWDMNPGEFENFPDAQYNKAQDEKRYVHLLGAELAANGMPNHALIDTSRNGVLGLRLYGGDWCNVAGAGFGVRPTSETDDDLADAFVWVKLGGESDGISDPSDPRYDTTCGRPDAFKPSPLAGLWNQAQFEQLVANAIPDQYTTDGRCHANIFCGSWPAGSCCTNGVCGTSCGSTCTSGCGDQSVTTSPGRFYEPPDGGNSNACSAFNNADDPGLAWLSGQAGLALDLFASTCNPNNPNVCPEIDKRIAQHTGFQTTNCGNLADTKNCLKPSTCPAKFSDVPYYIVQTAFSNFNGYLNQFMSGLTIASIISTDNINSLIKDIALPLRRDAGGLSGMLSGIGGVLSILSPAASVYENPSASAIFGVVGSILALAGTATAPQDTTADFILDTASVLYARAGASLGLFINQLSALGDAVFNKGDFSVLNLDILNFDLTDQEAYGYKTDIAKFFADGKFAKPLASFSLILADLTRYLNQNIISILLLSSDVYITKGAFPNNINDCYDGGGRMVEVNGQLDCYAIESPGVGLEVYLDKHGSFGRSAISVPLPPAIYYDILWVKYGIDFETLINNAVQCQAGTKGYGGIGNFQPVVDSSTFYPFCFFNLPVFTVETVTPGAVVQSTPCHLAQGKTKDNGVVGVDYLPDHLADTFDRLFCTPGPR